MPSSAPDDLDARIVDALMENGRASHRSIAREVDVAASTVTKRLRDLEANGAITGYQPRVDYAKFGYPVTAIVRLRTSEGISDDEGTTQLSSIAYTADQGTELEQRISTDGLGSITPFDAGWWTTVHRVTGSFDFVSIGRFPNLRSVAEAVMELRSSPGVIRTQTELVVETIREHAPLRQF